MARRFQRLCGDMDDTGLLKAGSPDQWYHGPTYHALAQKCEKASRPPAGAARGLQKPADAGGRNRPADRQLELEPEPEPEPEPVGGGGSGMAVLPIDAHRDDILRHIAQHRVTIIQGETGCGKSSRLPHMLMEAGGMHVKMMVAQPRRIAAHSLMDRAKQDGLSDIVGMVSHFLIYQSPACFTDPRYNP